MLLNHYNLPYLLFGLCRLNKKCYICHHDTVSCLHLAPSLLEGTAGATPTTTGLTASMTEGTAVRPHSPPRR